VKESSWIVTLHVQFDEEGFSVVKYGVEALTADLALARAGARAAKKLYQCKIMDARVEKEDTRDVIKIIDR